MLIIAEDRTVRKMHRIAKEEYLEQQRPRKEELQNDASKSEDVTNKKKQNVCVSIKDEDGSVMMELDQVQRWKECNTGLYLDSDRKI